MAIKGKGGNKLHQQGLKKSDSKAKDLLGGGKNTNDGPVLGSCRKKNSMG